MRLLFVVDGRSPIALNWIQYFVDKGHEVHLVSTFRCAPELPLASLHILPVAFGGMVGERPKELSGDQSNLLREWIPVGLRTKLRQWLGPLTILGAARRLREIIVEVSPDLIHAMRIPYEGMLVAHSGPEVPFLVSVWGNDFTLHAPSTSLMKSYTRLTMQRADALHADCQRDINLARSWGFPGSKPAMVLPGGGGIQVDLFHPAVASEQNEIFAEETQTVINPRGIRAYVRNDTFFRAIPLILERNPRVRFVCPAMRGEPLAENWVRDLGIEANVDLLPTQSRKEMAYLFQCSPITVSLTTHDGTPNTLLEAMACGSFPIAGDIESLREWIEPNVNGFLVDPADPKALAVAVLTALDQTELRTQAQEYNARLIARRAEYSRVMEQAEVFYRKMVTS